MLLGVGHDEDPSEHGLLQEISDSFGCLPSRIIIVETENDISTKTVQHPLLPLSEDGAPHESHRILEASLNHPETSLEAFDDEHRISPSDIEMALGNTLLKFHRKWWFSNLYPGCVFIEPTSKVCRYPECSSLCTTLVDLVLWELLRRVAPPENPARFPVHISNRIHDSIAASVETNLHVL